jgi:protein TonB
MKSIPSLMLKFNLILIFLCGTISFAQEDIDVPFSVIDDIPQFEICEKSSGKEARDCFNKQMQIHVLKNFNYPEEAVENNLEGKVFILFVIDKEGNVTNIKTRTKEIGLELLEKEAIRIIKKLPKFRPAIQRGKNVNVSYAIPINFVLPKEIEVKE